jgi:hypothetical protein
VSVCVCACGREKERERDRAGEKNGVCVRECGSIDRHIDMVFYVCPYRIFFFSDIRYYWIYAEKALYCVCVCVCVCLCLHVYTYKERHV